MKQGKIRKKIAWYLFQKSMLNKANFVHVTSKSEKKTLMDLGIISPIVTVPNGIPVELSQEVSIPKNSNGIRVLFYPDFIKKKV